MIQLNGYDEINKIKQNHEFSLYHAINTKSSQSVILKRYKPGTLSISELDNLKNQHQLVQKLDSPYIAKFYDLIEDVKPAGREVILAYEDISGIVLKDYFLKNVIHLEEFLSIAIQIATAVNDIHKIEILHQELRTDTFIYLPQTKKILISNPGPLLRLRSPMTSLSNDEFNDTKVMRRILPYISPEQTERMSWSSDYRTDLYSLGIIYYELLTGNPPFLSDEPFEIIHAHIARQPVPPDKIQQGILKPISNIVMKLLEKNPDNRFQSIYGLRTDLKNCLQQLSTNRTIESFHIAENNVSESFRQPQKLYGREIEIKKLLYRLDSVSRGNAVFTTIAGSAGIGKSCLAYELQKPISESGGFFISGKYDQYHHDVPYSAIIQAFQEMVNLILMENKDKIEIWKNKIIDAVDTNGQVIIDVIPEVEFIIGKQPELIELSPSDAQTRFMLVCFNFLKAFTQKGHPLTLFLDDLQWADSASLRLFCLLVEFDISHFHFIGVYRSNEIVENTLLSQTLKRIQSRKGATEIISLEPITEADVCQLTADTFHQNTGAVSSLSKIIYDKTGGNPFFINQFLELLHTENIFAYDFDEGIWKWEVEQIRDKDITDNVVDLLSQRIQKLDQTVQEILQIAACIGDRFDINTISNISQKRKSDITTTLWEAQKKGFIVTVEKASQYKQIPFVSEEIKKEIISESQDITFKFIHDRIRQTVYSQIDNHRKKEIHLKIGRALMEAVSKEKIEEHVFDIVKQLNLGIDLLKHPDEFSELIQANLIAGRKAKYSSAYDLAYNYLIIGIELSDQNRWETQYELTLSLYEEAAEAAYLSGRFKEMEQFVQIVLSEARSLLDKINVYKVQILALKAQNKLTDALKLGLSLLKQLEFPLPEKPKKIHIFWALASTKFILAGKQIENFTDMPAMKDPYKLAAVSLGSNVASAAYYSAPEFLPLIISNAIKLFFRYGTAPEFTFLYAGYGFILCGFLGDINTGHRFGNLALKSLEQFKAEKFRARTLFTVNAFIKHWKEHAKETLAPLKEAYEIGFKTGELEYAAISGQIYPEYLFFVGKELPEIEKELKFIEKSMTDIRQETNLNHNRICQQVILNLVSGGNNKTGDLPWHLAGKAYSENQMLPFHIEANDRSVLSLLYNLKIILCVMFQAYPQAVNYANTAEKYIDAAVGLMNVPLFYFYDSLARLAVFNDVSKFDQKRILKRVSSNQKKMKKWARHAPMNYLNKFYLVKAECISLKKRSTKASFYYDKAISLAKEHGYIQEEALAYELTAKHYLSRDMKKIATVFFNEACQLYSHWGADAVVENLKNKYTTLLIRPAPQQSGELKPLHLDYLTVIHSLQAISTDIILESLLKNLMKILMETAGASRILFLSVNNHKVYVESEIKADNSDVTIFKSTQLENFSNFILMPVINYVKRTSRYKVIKNVKNETTFSTDPYFLQNRPKSILCLPVLKQSQLTAILYFENTVATGAFTQDRIEILQLLSSQIAISFDNAQLYENLFRMEGELSKRLNIEQIIAAISSSFIELDPHQIDNGIDNALKILGEFSGEDRCFIFQNLIDEKHVDETNVWCAPDIDSGVKHFRNMPLDSYPWFKNKLENNEIVQVQTLDVLPSEAIKLKTLLEQQKIRSFLMTPMIYAGKLIGFLGISKIHHEKTWSDDYIKLLRTVSEILASACARKRAEVDFKIYQQQLRSLSSELVLTEERERRSIAIELHDRIGHTLANAMIKLGSVRKEAKSAGLTEKVEEINSLIDECIEDTRSLTFDLSPHILYDMGLEAAVDWLVEKMNDEHNINITFHDDMKPKPLDDSLRILIYQSIRELLFNIVKHAKAQEASVSIERGDNIVRVDITDNGIGIDFNKNKPYGKKNGGFGLFSIRERLNSQKGSFEIESISGNGTRIIMMFPVKKNNASKELK